MQAATAYLHYSDGIEVRQPDEEKLGRQVVETMSRTNKLMFEKHRHAIRDAHSKSHGVLKGELHVYENLPGTLAQGLFKAPKTYPVIIRFSTAQGAILPDTHSALRGMAIKVIGVEGKKFLELEADELTQDFLLVNYPVIPTGTVKDYLDQQQKLEKQADSPELFQKLNQQVENAKRKVAQAVGREDSPNTIGTPGSNILGDTYYSMAALRYGDYVAKISVRPSSASLQGLIGKKIDDEEIEANKNNFLADIVHDFFKDNTAEYELRAQLCTDLETMPVEDGSVQWPEDKSPYQPIGKIVIPPQETSSPARRVFADDVLSFNPFHCLPDHRPLGNIMRVRQLAYETSSKYRHAMNAQPRTEPRCIDELPD